MHGTTTEQKLSKSNQPMEQAKRARIGSRTRAKIKRVLFHLDVHVHVDVYTGVTLELDGEFNSNTDGKLACAGVGTYGDRTKEEGV
jgi:hypothetical protein